MSVPGYTIEAEILSNSTATLYRAREQAGGRVVCLEVFQSPFDHPTVDRGDYRGHVLGVARLLDHPNIWPAWRLGEAASGFYFVRPWGDGEFLTHHLIHHGRPEHARAADWVRQLALAVQHAHDHGVYHCDLKPSNVLLHAEPGGEPQPLLYGFETARLAFLPPALQLQGQPPEGAIMGTPVYMPPELLTGKRPDLTPAMDVWGLGVILYQLLVGHLPFRAATVLDVITTVLQREPDSPRAAAPTLDADLERITMSCLRKRPEERTASAAELANALDGWLRGDRSPPPSITQRIRSWIGGR